MNTAVLIVILILGIVLTGVVPVFACLYSKKKWGRTGKAFLFGVLAFVVSQVLLRIPLMNYAATHFAWYQIFSMKTIPFSIFTAFTAGLFEETARLLCFRFFLKDRRRNVDGIVFGFGHGGIEAFLLVGLNCLCMFLGFLFYKAVGAENLPNGIVSSGLLSALQTLEVTPVHHLFGLFFPGIWERIVAVMIQIGMTMIVLSGFQKKKVFRYYVTAIAVHTLVDAGIGIVPLWTASRGSVLLVCFTVFAVLLMTYVVIHCKKSTKVHS